VGTLNSKWGISQVLGEIARDPIWDVATREHSINLLNELYRGDSFRAQHESIKKWILNILNQICNLPDSAIMDHARLKPHSMKNVANGSKQMLRFVTLDGPSYPYPLAVRMQVSATSPLFLKFRLLLMSTVTFTGCGLCV